MKWQRYPCASIYKLLETEITFNYISPFFTDNFRFTSALNALKLISGCWFSRFSLQEQGNHHIHSFGFHFLKRFVELFLALSENTFVHFIDSRDYGFFFAVIWLLFSNVPRKTLRLFFKMESMKLFSDRWFK